MELSLSNKKIKIALTALAFIALGFLPYLMSIDNQFVSDDWHFLSITANSTKPLSSYFYSNYKGGHQGGSYRPMVNVFWTTAYNLFGLNSAGYHVLNILFHTLNIFLIFLLVKALPWFNGDKEKILAWTSAIIFSVLPNHAAAVNWISVVNDTLMTTFYLTATVTLLQAYVKQSKFYYFSSLLFLGLSILTKEMALTFPLIAFIFLSYNALKNNIGWRQFCKENLYLAPHWVIIILFFTIRYFAIGLFLSSYKGPVHLSFAKIYRSISSFFVSNFVIDEIRIIVTSVLNINYLASAIAVGCILFLLLVIIQAKKWSFFPIVLLLLYVVSLIPVFQFNVNFTPTFIYMNSEGARYAYLPSVFIAILLGVVCSNLWGYLYQYSKKIRIVLVVAFVGLVSLLGVGLITKNMRWNTAAQVTQTTLEQTSSILKNRNLDGVVLVGKPDSYRGAFIFRNGFKQALQLSTDRNIDQSSILTIKAGTVYHPEQNFHVSQVNTSTFFYQESNKRRLVVAPPAVKSKDYVSKLLDYKHNIYSISHEKFGTKLRLQFTDKFIETNRDKNIQILFYNNKNWISKKLSYNE